MSQPKQTLNVKVPAAEAGCYTIAVGQGILADVWADVRRQRPDSAVFVVTDSAVARAGHLQTLLGTNTAPVYVIEPAGEASKHIQTVAAIVEAMERERLGRDTVVLALGGGTVGDIAGFAAAIFKRGVPVVQIPTTTVAQADSAIGGKTGVDSSVSKNAFGVFWHPSAVYIDVKTLLTLDDRQYRAGLVESVKHAAIADAAYFEYLEKNIDRILQKDLSLLEHIAAANCRIKAAVVEEDPTEKNKRRILNYGHTIGHAVEAAGRFNLLHGECVAVGMKAAGQIEKALGLVQDSRLERIEGILKKLGMPTAVPAALKKEQILGLLRLDKKAVGQRPKFVLLESLGRVRCADGQWAADVPPSIVEEIISQLY